MQNMKLTPSDVQEMSHQLAVSHVKCMHKVKLTHIRASVSGRMDVIYVRILLPYAEKFDPGRMTYVQLLSITSV